RQLSDQGQGRHGPRARHRQADRGDARGPHLGGVDAGPRIDVPDGASHARRIPKARPWWLGVEGRSSRSKNAAPKLPLGAASRIGTPPHREPAGTVRRRPAHAFYPSFGSSWLAPFVIPFHEKPARSWGRAPSIIPPRCIVVWQALEQRTR